MLLCASMFPCKERSLYTNSSPPAEEGDVRRLIWGFNSIIMPADIMTGVVRIFILCLVKIGLEPEKSF